MNTTLKTLYDKLSETQQNIKQNKAKIKALKFGEKRLRREIERIEKIPEEIRDKLSDRYVKYIIEDDSCKLSNIHFIHMNELISNECSYNKKLLYNKSATVINIMYDRNSKEIKGYYYTYNSGIVYDPSKTVDITKEEFESYLPLNEQFTIYGD